MSLAFVVALSVFTLWDYYFGPAGEGLRLFDLAGVALIFVGIVIGSFRAGNARQIALSGRHWALLCAFVAFFVVSGVIGSVKDPENFLRPTSGVWMGLVVFLVFYVEGLRHRAVGRVLTWLIALHATALLTQLAVQEFTDTVINFQQMIGAEPRVWSAIFRPSGLFQEPSSYAVTMTMVWLLRQSVQPGNDVISWIALLSIILTVSLFGVLAVGSILVFLYWRRVSFWVMVVLTGGIVSLALTGSSEVAGISFLVNRLVGLEDDISFAYRYEGLLAALRGTGNVQRLWFGSGLANDFDVFGSSGFAFLLASVGIIGMLCWLLLCIALSPRRRRGDVLFILLLMLAAAPMWTFMFWWAWLGLLLRKDGSKSGSSASVPNPVRLNALHSRAP